MSKARDLANAGTALTSVSATELGYVDGVTSAIQTQLDAKLATATASSTYIPKTLTTTTGDIIYASGANTPARLGIGSTDQILKVSGGVPAWATPAAAGSMTLLSTTTISGTTNITNINQTYKQLYIVGTGIKSSATSQLRVWPRNSAPTDLQICGNWFSGSNQTNNPSTFALYPDNNNAYISTTANCNFVLIIDDYAQTTNKPYQMYGSYSRSGVSDVLGFHMFGSMYAATNMNELNLYSDAGLTQGTIKIYGVN